MIKFYFVFINIKRNNKLININILIKIFLIINFLFIMFFYKFKIFIKLNNNIREYNLNKIRNYLNICLNGILNNQIKSSNIYKNIEISVVIPVYNCQNSIINSIISIQNQKNSNFEIILIDDFSKDNTKQIIEVMKKKDSRIKIINNNKNMGTLYSRCIGVLFSKGKYIFPLDNDDMFLNEFLFRKIYKEAKNYDIIGFKAIRAYSYNSTIYEMYDDPFHMHENGLIIKQPELSHFSILKKECHIWGKSIRADLYKTAVNYLGIKKYSVYIAYSEDNIMIFILFQLAKNFKFVSKYGIYHLIHNNSASFSLSKDHILYCQIYLLEIIFDYSKNTSEGKNDVITNVLVIKDKFLPTYVLNNENRKYLKTILNKILNSNYINNENKIFLKEQFYNYSLFNTTK